MRNIRSSVNFCCIITALSLLLWSCSGSESGNDKIFESVSSEVTGIDFENSLSFDPDFNIYTYRNFYNGGGVATGDINGDGLPDLYLTGNMKPNRLYLNKGNFEFEDITESAGVAGKMAWSTGVSMADINGNGLLDIYVTNSGNVNGDERRNELFINNGDLTFTEKAAEYGLDDPGYGIHAVFFDYDGDDDLDMYLLNNSNKAIGSFDISNNQRETRDEEGGDKLFRNDDGQFTDVSEKTGIYGSEIGFSLSASVSDVNRDGLPDIYVANDFFERDYLYLNNGDGTFREVLDEQMRSISAASMGSDISDLTNNGWPDIYVADMLPADNSRLKTNTTFESWDLYQDKIKDGYGHQLTRNTLQLNNGDGTFSEVGRLAGVEATDWSWAVLMADFDSNGHNDIYVTNGLAQDITNLDYLGEIREPDMVRSIVTGENADFEKLISLIPSEPVGNFLFSNRGELAFEERSEQWGLGEAGFSSGAAWADLNGDGRLDLVVSDVNGPARIYRNRTAEFYPERNWLMAELEGDAPNTQGVGATLELWADGEQWYREHILQRGFQSSVAPGLHVGLGEITRVDSLRLRWPDGRVSRLSDVEVPARITLRQSGATNQPVPPPPPATMPGDFLDLTELSGCETCKSPVSGAIPSDSGRNAKEPALPGRVLLQPAEIPGLSGWSHRENDYSDFTRERLLVHMRSTEGPAMCTGDVNGDGLEDLYLGGARGQAGVLLVQQGDGGFSGQSPGTLQQDAGSEDTDCVLFDANGDGHTDLYVTSGGSSFSTGSSALPDRLYLGDGQGGVTRSDQIFPTPRRYVSSSAVAVGDLTGNGHPDLFVGERLRLFSVGVPAGGYLLANDGEGNFTEVTPQWAPGFSELGMITDAVWTDWDGDGREDLVVVGEWMSPKIYRNTGERLEQVTGDPGLEGLNGWWNAVHAADLNGDGREDLVLGNHGLNSQFRASREKPVRMWVGDFEGNGIIEQILSTPAGQGGDYPVALRHELAEEFTFIEQKYPEYADFGGQRVQDIFTEEQLSGAVQLQAQELASLILWNEPEGVRAERLPLRAQLSPVYGIWSGDLSGDGRPELVLGGNLHQVKPIAGPYDASYGVVIGFGQDGLPYSYPAGQSGLRVKGAVREISAVTAADGSTILLIARNNDSPKWFRVINSN